MPVRSPAPDSRNGGSLLILTARKIYVKVCEIDQKMKEAMLMTGTIIKRILTLALVAGLAAAVILVTQMVRKSFLAPVVNPLETSSRAAQAALLRDPTPIPTPTPPILHLSMPSYPTETVRTPNPHNGWLCMELYSDGALYAWDSYGVAEGWEKTDSFALSDRPSLIASNVVAAAAGYRHGIFLKADGTVWTFGNNEQGQLGIGEVSGEGGFAPVQVLRGCVAVASAHSTCAALTAEGQVYTWGDNACGQVGNGERGNGALTASDLIVPAPRPILYLITRIQLGASETTGADDHFEAFDPNEAEYVWGGRCPDAPTPYVVWIEERLPLEG